MELNICDCDIGWDELTNEEFIVCRGWGRKGTDEDEYAESQQERGTDAGLQVRSASITVLWNLLAKYIVVLHVRNALYFF